MQLMDLGSKIYVAGHTGLVGSAIRRRLEALGYSRLALRTCNDLDLTRQQAVEEFFGWERFDYVFLAPTNGGVPTANHPSPTDFLYQNLATQSNIFSSAYQAGVKRLIFVDSSCVSSPLIPYVQEKEAGSRSVDHARRSDAIVKMAGIEMCDAYNRLDGCRFLGVVPPSLYGCLDTYDARDLRLIPAMIFRMHWAKRNREREVVLPGTGDARREFLFSDDLADICISLMNLDDRGFESLVSHRTGPIVHVGGENNLTVRELAELIAEVVMFRGNVRFDVTNGATGRPNDLAQKTILRAPPHMELREGLHWAYNGFLSQSGAPREQRWKDCPRKYGSQRPETALHGNRGLCESDCPDAASFAWCFSAEIQNCTR